MVTYATRGESPTVTREEFEKIWYKPMAGHGAGSHCLADYHNFIQVSTRSRFRRRMLLVAAVLGTRGRRVGLGKRAPRLQYHLHQGTCGLVTGAFGLAGGLVSTYQAPSRWQSGAVVEMAATRSSPGSKSDGTRSESPQDPGGLGFVGGGIRDGSRLA